MELAFPELLDLKLLPIELSQVENEVTLILLANGKAHVGLRIRLRLHSGVAASSHFEFDYSAESSEILLDLRILDELFQDQGFFLRPTRLAVWGLVALLDLGDLLSIRKRSVWFLGATPSGSPRIGNLFFKG